MRTGLRIGLAAGALAAPLALVQPAAAMDPLVLQGEREASMSAVAFHRAYAEHFPAGVVGSDRESGWAPGVSVSASWMGGQGLFGSLTGDLAAGHLDYRGTAFNSTSPLDFQPGLTDWAVTGRAGKAFALGRTAIVPLAFGGYRLWHRDLGPGQIEDYRTWRLGGGVRADVPLTGAWLLKAEADAGTTLAPQVTLHYASEYEAPLGRTGLYMVSVGLDRALWRRVHLTVSAQAQWYGFGQSSTVQTAERGLILEPSSRTTDLRLGAGLGWAF